MKTLLQCIADGEIQAPALVRWNGFQAWRAGAGRRPTTSVDGFATTTAEESALWKATMLELYGPEWPLTLASADDEPAAGAAAVSSQPPRPSSTPAEGAGAPSTPRPTAREPGSGVEPGSGLDAARTGAPGSGMATPVPSWSSQNPGTP